MYIYLEKEKERESERHIWRKRQRKRKIESMRKNAFKSPTNRRAVYLIMKKTLLIDGESKSLTERRRVRTNVE